MLVGGCTGSSHRTRTVRAVSLVVVGLDFRSVGLSGIVHCVVKGDDLGVVGAVIVIEVVKPNVEAVNARIDDRHGNA